MLFIPITRPWAMEPVMAALNASDIPREVIIFLDAPGCWDWCTAFEDSGWHIAAVVVNHNTAPPTDRIARRARHLEMRRMSQDILQPEGRVLCIEDDTIVPPDVWARLSHLLDSGECTAASGVQFSRDGQHIPGVWRYNLAAAIYDPVWVAGIEHVDAVGHYCLMTTGSLYAAITIIPGGNEPVDRAHTKYMNILVDGDCICGHLCEDGTIIE